MAEVDEVKRSVVRFTRRCAELQLLRDGWLDGHGLAPTPASVATLMRLAEQRPSLALHACLYPTYGGGAFLERSSRGWNMSVEVQAAGAVEMFALEERGPGETDLLRFEEFCPQMLDSIDVLLGLNGSDLHP